MRAEENSRGGGGMDFLSLGKTGKDSWWRYVLGILMVIILPTVLMLLLSIVFSFALGLYDKGLFNSFLDSLLDIRSVDPIVMYVFSNSLFILYLLTILLVVRLIHRRKLLSLITPEKRPSLRKLAWGFSTFFVLMAVTSMIVYAADIQDYRFVLDCRAFMTFLPLALVLTPIQTTTEELFFRGYLLQGLGKITSSVLLLSVINGVLFTIPHLWNPEVKLFPFMALSSYFITGFLLCITALKSNGLEISIGVHTAINLFFALLVRYEPSPFKNTPSVFLTEINPVSDLITTCVCAVVFYCLLTRFLKKPVVRENITGD